MSLKSQITQVYANLVYKSIQRNASEAIAHQERIMMSIVRKASKTIFGVDHNFSSIDEHKEFKDSIPVREYEELLPYMDRWKRGERDVLWPGVPKYFCKTSGTTAGTKYIPLTADSLPNHIHTARNALLCYTAETGHASFVDGKTSIFGLP